MNAPTSIPSPDPAAARFAPSLPEWNPEADDALIVRAIRDETPDVKTFVLAPRSPCVFRYAPGQFLTLELEIGGETINRCYTIASAPTRPHTLSITVKRVPGGPVSNFLHDHIKVGSVIRAVGPMGDFSCLMQGTPGATPKYLFLSGGSGITPLMSMARTFHDLAEPRYLVFVHAARSPVDIVFRAELELMARNQPGHFRFAPICEADSPFEPWHGLRGRLNLGLLNHIAPDYKQREIFVCGPSPFMAAVREMLKTAGFDMARHHEESFDFAELAAAEPDVAAEVIEAEAAAKAAEPEVATYTVTFAKQNRSIECRSDMFVLDAARRNGVRLPSSCSKGLCGTCKSKLVSGTVDMKHGGGIRQREIDAGMALLCCSRPTSDLVVDR
ncbi:hybrid-cluster NAD(P)-dependent oxidoreductase [Ancylobacter defluvii]|uniref:Hybrid-cluster NAD(P)-dependent oxidoreductase n=1 Tax=Ancylobacter defluvii TaxID=1282440 RepID=A0A9W6N970_9HYPH|nr:hybrid-cluster NAD(P)-dependent oxidoreductase [Ancylobacter defluvii]MBS7587461.1 hybrid-cluster NAD(P)-dependent oxidoreductase [Ancylobacter defluvii]GLK82152.1 hybrid-cluster NAD(P)-dependent oxidoreductase [Ancylobacter defluvii]